MNYAPGPWAAQGFVVAYEDMGPVDDLCRLVDNSGRPFIYVRRRDNDVLLYRPDEGGLFSANVQLVKIAPELLAALEEMVDTFAPLLADADLDAGSNPAWLAVERARNLIARVKA